MLKEWEEKDPLRAIIRSVTSLDIPGIKGPVSGLIRIDPGMEETVAAGLGEKLNYIVCETTDAAQRAIHFLETNELGRATFIVLDRLPEASLSAPLGELPGARALISLMRYDASLENCMRFLCAGTLVHGRSFYGRAVIQGGGKFAFDKPVLIEEQVRRLTEERDVSGKELASAEEEGKTLQADVTRTQEERRSLDAQFQKAGVDLGWLDKNLATLKEERAYLDKETALINSDLQSLEQEEKEIRSRQESNQASLAALEADEKQARERLAEAEKEIQANRDEETQLTPLLTESKVAWATHASELESREREEKKIQESIETLTAQTVQAREELEYTEKKTAELKNIQQTESENLKRLHQELAHKETDVQASLSVRQSLARQLDEKSAALHEVRQQGETLKAEIHDLQLEQRSFDLQKQGMEQRLREDFAVSFEEARPEYEKESFSEEEISRLKRRIESMGAVNLAAPEEYANLEERYNFLLTQQQDLLKAKEDLHQVIVKINQNTRENFKKTYDQVRENFRNLYRQLFEGGVADLTLTDESNLLECGVDIFAQPPGKKLQNIALLSGGEKALTAIALLFAFFMVKPSPFCILDEVDAPLDDANIGRYINMIKTFAEKSQFLVITHNKRTMEMADILYGVTMEELGVSKIISVRLNKEDFAETA
jgi:Chromosome segregation ATPases